ncbi:MAG: hypothetical protein MJ095_08655 [Oscillospiraceae bacterium]|nr:hypothetical protein [Oscillospiraceae bacterium]
MFNFEKSENFTADERETVYRIQKYVDENKGNLKLDLAEVELIRYDDGKLALKYSVDKVIFAVSEGVSSDTFEFLDLNGNAGLVDTLSEYAEMIA